MLHSEREVADRHISREWWQQTCFRQYPQLLPISVGPLPVTEPAESILHGFPTSPGLLLYFATCIYSIYILQQFLIILNILRVKLSMCNIAFLFVELYLHWEYSCAIKQLFWDSCHTIGKCCFTWQFHFRDSPFTSRTFRSDVPSWWFLGSWHNWR